MQGCDRFSLADAACARGHCRAGAGGTVGWEKSKVGSVLEREGGREGMSCARRGTPVFGASALGQVCLRGIAARLPSPVPPHCRCPSSRPGPGAPPPGGGRKHSPSGLGAAFIPPGSRLCQEVGDTKISRPSDPDPRCPWVSFCIQLTPGRTHLRQF